MEYGQGTMEYGRCTMDLGPWTMEVHNPWSLVHAPWLMVLMHMYLCICTYNINNIYKHNTSTYTASAQYLKRIFL